MADFSQIAQLLSIPEKYTWVLILAAIWSLTWKAIACWKAARKNHVFWFILLFVINTIGIFEILYIFLISEMLKEKKNKKKK